MLSNDISRSAPQSVTRSGFVRPAGAGGSRWPAEPYTLSGPWESNSLLSREQCGWRHRAATHDGQELADQTTILARVHGGSPQDCPGRQEDGIRGSRESDPPEDRYKANPAVPAPRSLIGPEGGGPVRYYVGVDWADQTHAVWVADERGTKLTARTVPHAAGARRLSGPRAGWWISCSTMAS